VPEVAQDGVGDVADDDHDSASRRPHAPSLNASAWSVPVVALAVATPAAAASDTGLGAYSLDGSSRLITLTGALAAGATMAFRTTLATTIVWTMNASSALPSGYTASGSKTTATVRSTTSGCTAG
jgi:hypothetical protein